MVPTTDGVGKIFNLLPLPGFEPASVQMRLPAGPFKDALLTELPKPFIVTPSPTTNI